ncbi:bromodomain adjacent to zinc finger domain protein 1A-like [Lingula anatina]|uniref:Bromodomain adjacent to zinc finger domain protein 1A n=1 Tax=Lingula anatina TaxID=7574 RepID=A0A1S3HPG5_LINAN|nr:bromodomain adjacent to zinc finger domain protein 1A-like [Lingula anatina]|eukprot:XP_013387932.1 bromodomain adjacent to zinc finger domain protein 1A-like [Lingula anatina]
MPLLKRQPFEKNSVPSDIKPDEEVFYCPLTNEIFRDYEEFFERIILCNSLVWSCSITGRSGLTYQEALESEERARKHLSSFPFYLHKPILFLATKTHRSRLNDMNDDVFVFTKDRYFVGEVVEVIHEGERKSCKILKVLPPTPLPNGDVNGTSPSTSEAADQEDVDNYRYVVQKIGKGEKGDPFIADAPDVNRKKGLYTRDKSKLFLKSHCEASEGIWKVKEKYIRKHHLDEVNFKSMFPSAIPTFETSEVKKKPKQNKSDVDLLLKKAKKEHKEKKEKKEKKQKIDEKEPKKLTEEEKEAMKQKLLLEKEAMKALKLAEKQEKQEELRKKLEEEKERRREEREKLKEEKKLKAEYLKEWSKPRDDMECDDLKVLPDPTPVKTRIPEELFGDVMMVLEMLHVFGPLLEIKDEFPHGVSMDMMEKALLEKDVDGTLADLLGFLLVSIFNLQQEEEEEEEEIEKEEKDGNLTAERVETIDEDTDIADLSTKDLIQAATVASQWPHLYHGTPLRNLQLDSLTLTEILRLHFLSSGAHANASNAKFRYQQRGGYTSLDDAGMEFKMQESAIIKALSTYNVFDLSPGEKMKVIIALVHQLLTYASSRDFIEDNFEKLRQAKMDLRHHQWAEQRREKEEAAARYKKRVEERAKERELEAQKKEQRKKEAEEKLKADETKNGEQPEAEDNASKKNEEEKEEEDKTKNDKDKKEDESQEKKGKKTPAKGKKGKSSKDKNQTEEEEVEEDEEDIDESKLSPEEREALRKKREEREAELKELFMKREAELHELVQKLQHGNAVYPLGRDRVYRRFWVFRSVPGLFVEDEELYVPDDLLLPVTQTGDKSNPFFGQNLPRQVPLVKPVTEEKSTASDKENDSFDANNMETGDDSVAKMENPLGTNTVNSENIKNGSGDGTVEATGGAHSSQETQNAAEKNLASVGVDSKPYEEGFNSQIIPQSKFRWAFYSSPEDIENLLESLNPRGYREGSLKQTLMEQKSQILKSVQETPVDLLIKDTNEESSSDQRYVNIKSRNRTTQGAVKNNSAQEFLELQLRELLLDTEERIYAGSLGTLKVKDRLAWREALEQGTFDVQCDNLTWAGKVENTGEAEESKMDTDDESPSHVVKDLAKALIQIEQCVEPKFINPPLGEAEDSKKAKQKAALEAVAKKSAESRRTRSRVKDDPKDKEEEKEDDNEEDKSEVGKQQKTPLERWEESLMSCTSLPQVCLYLATLDRSITWSKSALNARCRICRRKGDGEKMLLCDGCDRGHHMYCLKPPMKDVPKGDWYCPDCRPKVKLQSPRKRRKTFSQSSDEEEEEESEEEEEEDESEDEEDEEEDQEESSEEEEESEEEEPTPAKPKKSAIRIKGTGSGRSTPTSVKSESRRNSTRNSPADARPTRSKNREQAQDRPASRSRPGRDSPATTGHDSPSTSRTRGGRTTAKRAYSDSDEVFRFRTEMYKSDLIKV